MLKDSTREIKLNDNNVLRLLLKLAIPASVAQFVSALYNVVDRAFVGRGVGAEALGGVQVTFPYVLISLAFIQLIGVGSVTHFSINLGKDKKQRSELYLVNGLFMLVVSALLVSIAGLFLIDPILRGFGATAMNYQYAKDYLIIIIIGFVFSSISVGMNNFIRAEGSANYAMVSIVTGAVLNFILDYVLIFIIKWGVKGAAIATVISQACSAFLVMYYFVKHKNSLFKLRFRFSFINLHIMGNILSTGSSAFIFQILTSGFFIFLNNFVKNIGGNDAFISMGIITSLMYIILMPLFGINQSVNPIVGYNYGARNYKRVKKTLKYAIFIATAIVCAGYIFTFIFTKQTVMLFVKDNTGVIEFATKAMRIFLFFLPFLGFQIISANFFQAIGKSRHALILNMSRQIFIILPAVIIVPLFTNWGIMGILYSGPVSDLFASGLTALLLTLEIRKINAMDAASGTGN